VDISCCHLPVTIAAGLYHDRARFIPFREWTLQATACIPLRVCHLGLVGLTGNMPTLLEISTSFFGAAPCVADWLLDTTAIRGAGLAIRLFLN